MKHRTSDNFSIFLLLAILATASTIINVENCGRYRYQIENAVMLARTAMIKALLDVPSGTSST